MGHYVFLVSWDHPRMPVGERNEWAQFNTGPEYEGLEARNTIPVFWWCMFSPSDLKHARWIDEVDLNDRTGDRDYAGLGAQREIATYPYFATETAVALSRLTKRRSAILTAIGEKFAPIYDAFTAMVARELHPCVIMETSDFPDVEDCEDWLRSMVTDMDVADATGAVPDNGPLSKSLRDFQHSNTPDPVAMLAGYGTRGWPHAELDDAFPRPRDDDNTDAQSSGPQQPSISWTENIGEWALSLLSAGAGLGAWYLTHSWIWGVIAFLIVALGGVFLTRKRS